LGLSLVVSYPKSGNTWIRFLLASYLLGPIAKSDLVEERIPYLDLKLNSEAVLAQTPPLAKTHELHGAWIPMFEHIERYVYIIRHPKDVLLSNLNFRKLVATKEVAAVLTDTGYVEHFIKHGGELEWLANGYGSLEENIASWLDKPPYPHLLVRYEDMKANTAAEFRKILEFFQIPVDDKRMADAIKASSFDQVKALEVREKFAGKTPKLFSAGKTRQNRSVNFMNQGKVRGSLAHISPELDKAFDQRFAALMTRFGYATPAT
jgi:hypothetical protein